MTGVVRRLAGMEPGELRFRLGQEIRKYSGRLSAGVIPPRWERRRFASLSSASAMDGAEWRAAIECARERNYPAAHAALARHFTTRTSPFPLNARDVPRVAAAMTARFPDAPLAAGQLAEEIASGLHNLLGHRQVSFGTPIDWHLDPISGRRSPLVFWSSVPYLSADAGDHKVTWEINRHQHWLVLGRAFALTGDRRSYDTFRAQLSGWLAANPPLMGTNWASMLELALRCLSWLWAIELFAGAAGPDDEAPWLVDMLTGLDRQLAHVEHNLSRYFSPNTHLSGEGLALYVAGLAIPELEASGRRAAIGREILVREATRQVRRDGGHAELSTHYHRYSTDFYLLACRVAVLAGDPAAPLFEDTARRQARYLRLITDDAGVRPAIGDDDGGQLFPICGRSSEDCRDTLATAALLLRERSLVVDAIPEESYWISGAPTGAEEAVPPEGCVSGALVQSGYYVSRTARGDHLVFDAGPLGFLNAGHAHADALSCTLTIGGRPVLVDPGTGTYTMDEELRNRFRSTMMHNTVVVDGRTQSEPRGPFHWASRANASASLWHSSAGCDYAEGTHDGYLPRRHARAILAIHGIGWFVWDTVTGTGTAAVDGYWHIHPAWRLGRVSRQVCRLENGRETLALASTAPLDLLPPGGHPLAVWSPAYGVVEPAPTVRSGMEGALPATMATFIPAVPGLSEGLWIREAALATAPGDSWHAAAFEVGWNGGRALVLRAIERSGVPEDEGAAPSFRWGTAALQTDARCAVLIERDTACEATLVGGSSLVRTVGSHVDELISCAGRVPLLRTAVPPLARGVHEVGTVQLGTE